LYHQKKQKQIKITNMKKVAILGTGSVAQTWAKRLVELGNQVTIGTRNVENTLTNSKDGSGTSAVAEFLQANTAIEIKTFADAVQGADIVVNATKGDGSVAAVAAAAPNMQGKTLIDLSNPLEVTTTGGLPTLLPELSNSHSLGEEIQKQNPGIHVVKTLNTMWCGIMVNPNMISEGGHVNFLSGNSAEAKAEVKEFVKTFGWKEEQLLDLGDISAARGTEGVLPLWLRIWTATQNGAFNFKLAL
jgi:8-hydroxy-5-deazaflavin:NADPH oxidoreductase